MSGRVNHPGQFSARTTSLFWSVFNERQHFLQENDLTPYEFLHRHHTGDWGDLDPEDVEANRAALHYGSRLLSSYEIGNQKLWIITEADRGTTTVLLPEEY